MDNKRNVKQWKEVINLRSRGLTFDQISKLTGISRQRCHQIIEQAKYHAGIYDDELSTWIKENMIGVTK